MNTHSSSVALAEAPVVGFMKAGASTVVIDKLSKIAYGIIRTDEDIFVTARYDSVDRIFVDNTFDSMKEAKDYFIESVKTDYDRLCEREEFKERKASR